MPIAKSRTGKTNNFSPPVERFWAKVCKDGPVHPTVGQCWIWAGWRNPVEGYGLLCVPEQILAHRYSWTIHRGLIPEGLQVLHRCDNPSCVNPSHLFLGTNLDNVIDRNQKGRQAKGEGNGRAVLTDNLVREIRRRHKSRDKKDGIKAMSKELGVSSWTIADIVNRETWRHVE